MEIKVSQTSIAQSRVQQVSVGEIKIGAVHIDQLTLNNVHVQTSTGLAQMRNVRLSLTLAFALDWRVGVKISMPDGIPDVNFSDSGTLDLGSITLGIVFGNITLPGLANLSFDIPTLPVNDLAAVVGPIKNLNLGSVLAEQIRAQNLVTPTGGFNVSGLGVGGVSVSDLSIPDAAVGSATIGRISGGTLPIP